jgi:hypothetical protein
MIELIDQSDPEKLRFRCTVCEKEWIAPNRAFMDFHKHASEIPKPKAGAVEVTPSTVAPPGPMRKPKPVKAVEVATAPIVVPGK